MFKLTKKLVVDENNKPVAVQIPIEEFRMLEELIKDCGLVIVEEVGEDDETDTVEARRYYELLRKKNMI